MNEDERKGCPSASAFGQYNACPGSFTLNKAAPEAPPSPAAARGTRVHAACAGETSIELLAKDEKETVKLLLANEKKLLETFTTDGWIVADELTEKRFWDEATESRWSGKADRVYLLQKNKDKIALIVDFKSSRYTTRAQESLQLAALSTLVDRHYQSNLNEVHVALVFPDGYDQAPYDADALETVSEECKGLVDRATITETQKRYPSQEACRWCNAKSICPETRGNLNEVSKLTNTAIAPSDLPRLLAVSQVAKMLIKDIEEQARVVLKSGKNVDGWELKEGTTRSKITDTQEVYRRAAVIGIDGEAFANSVSISKKDLEALLKEELGLRGKQVKTIINQLTEGCTTDTVAAPSLKQKKG